MDLFTGTGRVAWHVAESLSIPVIAADLQQFSAELAGSVIERTDTINVEKVERTWIDAAVRSRTRTRQYRAAGSAAGPVIDRTAVLRARELCETEAGGPIWNAYGGHYYSAMQAATFDTLLQKLSFVDANHRRFCRAVLILAASRCAAAPGHTAQPFQPTASALPYIEASWRRDPVDLVRQLMPDVARRYAKVRGHAVVGDANELAL